MSIRKTVRATHRAPAAAVAGLLFFLFWALPAHAWLFFEHARIAKTAVQSLDPTSASLFQQAWARAQLAVPHYCSQADVGPHFYVPADGAEYCIDFSGLTGLSADHSCSPADTTAALDRDYVLRVLHVAEETEVKLRSAETERAHVDIWHSQNVDLQVADPDYLTRAAGNGAHFQLTSTPKENQEADDDAAGRPVAEHGLEAYIGRALSDRQNMNAIALYLNFHIAALEEARLAAKTCSVNGPVLTCAPASPAAEAERDRLFATAFADEAFAIHFLEDAFSAGHMLSAKGGDATRMGTHDYYCEHGTAARTWDGHDTYVAHGDSFMSTTEDLPRAKRAVAASLDSFLHAIKGDVALGSLASLMPRGDLDVCHAETVPPGLTTVAAMPEITEALPFVIRPVIEPPGEAETSNELGVFIMPNAQLAVRVGAEDFAGTNKDKFFTFARWPVRMRAGFGIGGTATGVTNDHQDGAGWFEFHVMFDGRPPGSKIGTRLGAGGSFHLPYFLVPGDLLPLLVLYGFDQEAFFKAAIRASDGGLLGLQSRHRLPLGWTFQFVLGREASFDLMPPPQVDTNHTAFTLSGKPGYWQLGLPVFSLTTVHVSERQIGLDAAFELGYDLTRYVTGEPGGANHGDIYHGIFLSYGYAGRHYFGSGDP